VDNIKNLEISYIKYSIIYINQLIFEFEMILNRKINVGFLRVGYLFKGTSTIHMLN